MSISFILLFPRLGMEINTWKPLALLPEVLSFRPQKARPVLLVKFPKGVLGSDPKDSKKTGGDMKWGEPWQIKRR